MSILTYSIFTLILIYILICLIFLVNYKENRNKKSLFWNIMNGLLGPELNFVIHTSTPEQGKKPKYSFSLVAEDWAPLAIACILYFMILIILIFYVQVDNTYIIESQKDCDFCNRDICTLCHTLCHTDCYLNNCFCNLCCPECGPKK